VRLRINHHGKIYEELNRKKGATLKVKNGEMGLECRKGVLMCFHVECESPELIWVRSDKDLDKG
jgi:hypothetical protein